MPAEVPVMSKEWVENAHVNCVQLLFFTERKAIKHTGSVIPVRIAYQKYMAEFGHESLIVRSKNNEIYNDKAKDFFALPKKDFIHHVAQVLVDQPEMADTSFKSKRR